MSNSLIPSLSPVGALAGACLAALMNTATAAPIPFQGGVLDGSFIVYDLTYPDATSLPTLTVRHSYQIGTDFMTGIPDSYQDPQHPQPYHAAAVTNPPLNAFVASALTRALPADAPNDVVIRLFGWYNFTLDVVNFQPVHVVRSLDDACDASSMPPAQPYIFDRAGLIAARGHCTFDTKWTNIEDAGFDAGIIVNNVPGQVFGFAGITSSHNIPLILVSEDVGNDLRDGSLQTFVGDAATPTRTFQYPAVFSIEISWTPNVVAEPATISLLSIGLLGLGLRSSRRSDPQRPTTADRKSALGPPA